MSDINALQERNEELARQVYEEARRDPQSPYANKCVGIANGQHVVAADDFDELILRLQQVEPDLGKCYCVYIEPNAEFNEANTIWGL